MQSSFIYNSCLDDAAAARISFGTDSIKALLVSDAYVPSKDGHNRRSDVFGEVTGEGYGPAGKVVPVSVKREGNELVISLGGARWAKASIIAHGAVYYKSRGGLATQDELIAFIGFTSPVTATNGAFALSPSTLRLKN